MDANNNNVEEVGHYDFTGFNKKSKRDTIYFRIFENTICRVSKAPIEGWEGPIKTTNPQTKEDVFSYVERYDNLIVYVANVEKSIRTFPSGGKVANFNFTLLGGPNKSMKAILQLQWIEPVLKRLLKVAPNVDWSKPLYISVFPTTRDGKTGTAVSFKQGDGPNPDNWQKVEEFYKRDDGVLPEAIYNDIDDSYNFDVQNGFLGAAFVQNTVPMIKALAKQYGIQDQAQQQSGQGTSGPSDLKQAGINLDAKKAEAQRQAQLANQQLAGGPPPAINDAWIEQQNATIIHPVQQPPVNSAASEIPWATDPEPPVSPAVAQGWGKIDPDLNKPTAPPEASDKTDWSDQF